VSSFRTKATVAGLVGAAFAVGATYTAGVRSGSHELSAAARGSMEAPTPPHIGEVPASICTPGFLPTLELAKKQVRISGGLGSVTLRVALPSRCNATAFKTDVMNRAGEVETTAVVGDSLVAACRIGSIAVGIDRLIHRVPGSSGPNIMTFEPDAIVAFGAAVAGPQGTSSVDAIAPLRLLPACPETVFDAKH